MTTKIWSFGTLGFILLACSIAGCERQTQVRFKGGVAPVFDLSGSGAVAIFSVYSPDYMTKAKGPNDEDFALWKIKASGGYFSGTWISDLGSISYGVVPSTSGSGPCFQLQNAKEILVPCPKGF